MVKNECSRFLSKGEIPMLVTIKLFATFRTGRFGQETREYAPATTVGDILNELNLPLDEIGATLINHIHVEEDQALQDGDVLSIFPLVGGG
jgi:molybdopterin synthase sulfur carrier subunit